MAGMAGAPYGAKVYLRVKLANMSGAVPSGPPLSASSPSTLLISSS